MLFLPKLGLKRRPSQDRSRDLVAAIEQAAVLLFVQDGYVQTSMNAIADRAGVAIGSLYQYFSSKEALLTYVVRMRMQRNLTSFAQCVEATAEQPLAVGVRMLVDELARFLADDHPLRRLFIRHLPPIGAAPDAEIAVRYLALLKQFLGQHHASANDEALSQMAFRLVHGVEGIIDAAARSETNLFAERAFVETLYSTSMALIGT